MNHLLLRAWRRTVRRIGLPGVLALLLALPTAATVFLLPRLNQQSNDIRAALAMQVDAMSHPVQPVSRPKTDAEWSVDFVAALPPFAQSASDLAKVFDIAGRHQVTLPKGDYQLKDEPHTALVTLVATFPVKLPYGTLKNFTADVLEALPNVSLDELRMARDDAGSSVLDAVIRFTFIYRSR